jgi:hypothetical protein
MRSLLLQNCVCEETGRYADALTFGSPFRGANDASFLDGGTAEFGLSLATIFSQIRQQVAHPFEANRVANEAAVPC